MDSKKPFISLEGFTDLLKEIEKAGGKAQDAVIKCAKDGAEIMQKELKNQMQGHTSSRLIKDMPSPDVKFEGGAVHAHVGYKVGDYNPKNLTDGFKFIFINYGTPRIKPAREFIKKAKRKATPKIKKMQEQTFNEILEGLKK